MNPIDIEYLSRHNQNSEYDWANITYSDERVGKARCLINDDVLTIYSINIYPEFEGRGFGKQFVEISKTHFTTIIADRVRHTAIGFWAKCQFIDNNDGNWIWKK